MISMSPINTHEPNCCWSYQLTDQLNHHHGGWPVSIILNPNQSIHSNNPTNGKSWRGRTSLWWQINPISGVNTVLPPMLHVAWKTRHDTSPKSLVGNSQASSEWFFLSGGWPVSAVQYVQCCSSWVVSKLWHWVSVEQLLAERTEVHIKPNQT